MGKMKMRWMAGLLAAAVTAAAIPSEGIHAAETADQEIVAAAAASFTLPYTNQDVYGNITLPEQTKEGVSVRWTTGYPDIVDVQSHTNEGYAATPAGVITRPQTDTTVTVTATFTSGSAEAQKDYSFTVKQAVEKKKTEDYLFVHFTGSEKTADEEQLYFAASADGNNWTDLNNSQPVLRSTVGDKGVRDPFLLRSAEGDKFYMLATDLSIYNRTNILGYGSNAWASSLTPGEGSTGMVVWESTDLIHWENERLVDVAGPIGDAGNLWAPEAFYDEITGEYIVYWASCSESTNGNGDVQNIYYAKTRDFYSFTDPELWIDTEGAILDTTMIRVGNTYYRASAADGQIRLDQSDSIFGEWETIGTLESIFNNTGYSGTYLEGPELFAYCEDDWLTGEDGTSIPTFGLICDRFKERTGYLPFRSTNLSDSTNTSWSVAADVNFGALKKRHGSILPITAEEYDRVMENKFSDTDSEDSAEVTAPINVKKVEGLSEDFIHGVDVSTYMSEIQSGAKYYNEAGNEQNMFQIFEDAGVNYARLRVWNCPYRVEKTADGKVKKDADGAIQYLYVDEEGNEYTESQVTTTRHPEGYQEYALKDSGKTVYREGYGAGNCDLDTAIETGKIATAHNMKVLIDFHYSDFWADPGKYKVPKEWEGMTLEEKADALYQYTKDSLLKLKAAGVNVGMVQIGNEINGGLAGEATGSGVSANVITLLQAGSRAVREVDQNILIAVHFTNPERSGNEEKRAAALSAAALDYDVFATSYYPFWHGTTDNLTNVLNTIATTYHKKVMVAEISYATSLRDGDGHTNVVGSGNTLPYPVDANGEGQAAAIRDVIEAVARVSGGNGIGTFYWEPAWIPVQNYADAKNPAAVLAGNIDKWEKFGSGWSSKYSGPKTATNPLADGYDPGVKEAGHTHGSEWDNQAYFDFNGKALPSINVYKWVYTGAKVKMTSLSKAYEEIFPDAENESAGADELITDKAFEQPLTDNGWNFTDPGVWYGAGTFENAAAVGNKNAVGAANGGIYQKLYLEGGKTYEVSMELYLTGSPANSGIGIYSSKGDKTQYTADFKCGYNNLASAGTILQPLDFEAYNKWQTLKLSFMPDTSGYYFVSLWGGDSSNTTYLTNVSCMEMGTYDFVTEKMDLRNTKGITFTSQNQTKAYLWSELLGDAYDKDQYVQITVTGIAAGNELQAAAVPNDTENPPDDNNPDDNNQNPPIQTPDHNTQNPPIQTPDHNKTDTPVSYTVTFDGNGGKISGSSTGTVTNGAAFGKLPAAKRRAYIFMGWYTAKTGGSRVTEATPAAVSGNITLFAHWKKVTAPSKVKNVKAKNSAKKTMKITFKKVSQADGYEIRYSLKSNMKRAKKVSAASASKTIKKLKKGSTYYVLVRAYKKDSTGKKYYSKAYSKKTKVTIKK